MTIRVHLSALLAPLALVLAAAALGAGPVAAATPPTLTVAVSPEAVVYPASAVVSGTLSVPNAGLSLFALPAGATEWQAAGSTTTTAAGAFSFKVAPAVSTDYRVVYGGASGQDAQTGVSLRVRPLVTMSFPTTLWLGGRVLLRGAVEPKHAGGTVVIDRRVDGAWQPLLTATLSPDSTFSLPWAPDTFGYYRLRVHMDADTDHDVGVSKPTLVTVNRPNAHRVPMHYAHYIVIVRHEFRLYYYEHGALVRGFDVVLGRPGYSTPLGFFHIYGKRRPAGGALGACAMFYRRHGAIAIHGTNQPYLLRRPVPRDFSHGCARMRNHQALWLYARVPVGTPVHNLR
jgi:lipoprotein-anchoring transpeptidase ErfK/SrfK